MAVEQVVETNKYLLTNVLPRSINALENAHRVLSEAGGLRPHQLDTIDAIAEVLRGGDTACHIAEATGSGKTAIALQVASALMQELRFDTDAHDETHEHGVAIFVSPTLDILSQTHGAAESFAQGITVTDYYGQKKDTTGDVINTTYQSLPTLLNALESQGKHVRLLIADEVHMAIGDVRHTVLRDPKLDGAIMLGLTATPYFEKLDLLIEDGRVDEDERWVGMFRTTAKEVTISDGIEMGILSPLDIHVFHTDLQVHFDVANGKYKPEQVNAFVRNQQRSMMGVAMVAGLDGLQKMVAKRGIAFSLDEIAEEKRDEIRDINAKIQGKQTLLFGSTVDHLRETRAMLIDAGIPEDQIGLFYGEINKTQRDNVKKAFQEGKIKYLLGIKALGVGVDLPEAEVGIFMVPHLSPIDVEQELGRIMRRNGDKRATAIQLYDEYVERTRPPVLIPQVLDPEVALQYFPQLRRGRISDGQNEEGARGRERPNIQITGMSLEEFKRLTEGHYQSRLARVSEIEGLGRVLDDVARQVMTEISGVETDPIQQYEEIIQLLPLRTPQHIGKLIIESLQSKDERTVNIAKKALVLFNLKTIVRIASDYSEYYNISDLVHEAVADLLTPEKLQRVINPKIAVTISVNNIARGAMRQYIGNVELMKTLRWIDDGSFIHIKERVESYLGAYPNPSPVMVEKWKAKIIEEIPELSESSAGALDRYIEAKMAVMDWDPQVDLPLDELLEQMISIDAVQEVLKHGGIAGLTQRERDAIVFLFGLEDERDLTLVDAARMMGVSRERVRQLEMIGLAKLRHPRSVAQLDGVIAPLEPVPPYPTYEE